MLYNISVKRKEEKKMTTIKYTEDIELWKLQDELKENGYRKTSDCYWFQTFIDDKGNLIALEREEETALKSL